MKRARIVLVAAVLAASCRTTHLKPNPLAGADPKDGFVADAFAKTGTALDAAKAEGLFGRDRIAVAADPLGVVRIAIDVESARDCAGCAQPAGAQQALFSFVQNTAGYVSIASAHADALERWGSLGIAHAALAIANLEEPRLDDAARADIRAKADGLDTALQSPLGTLDWTALTVQLDPLLAAELDAHAAFPLPSAAVVSSADALSSAVTGAIDRLFPGLPLPDLCCSKQVEALSLDSAAYQSLRRLPIVREWLARVPADTAPGYVSALVPIAAGASGNGVGDPVWASYFPAALAHETRLSAGLAALQAGLLVDAPGITGEILSLPPQSVDDPNARGFGANVASADPGTPGWSYMDPDLTLRTSAEISFLLQAPSIPEFSPHLPLPATPAPAPSGTDYASGFPPAGPVAIAWTVRAAHPTDHIDLRIHRGTTLLAHFVERADGAGQFPTRTVFDPATMDPGAPAPGPSGVSYASYKVEGILVDAAGRVSRKACTQIDVSFGHESASEDGLGSGVAEPIRGSVCDHGFESTEAELDVTSASFTIYQSASGYRVFDPFLLFLPAGTTQLSIHNADTIPVQMKSIYTPPYYQEFPPIPLSIGGVAPLDSGTIAPGATVTVPIPASVPVGTRWYLYDVASGSRVRLDRL